MGVHPWYSAIPVNLTHRARDLLERAEDVSVEYVCLLAYRARLEDPYCLSRLDLAQARTLSAWLADEEVRTGVEVSAARARLREALDAIIEWPRELGLFVDPVGERSWLVSGGPTSGDPPTGICYELDLVAESGLCSRAVSIEEAEAALESMGHDPPERSLDRGLGVWSAADDAVAAAEGWGLFDTGRDPHVEVQCLDVPDPGDGVLRDDLEAWDCVLDGLLRGSPVHARALGVLLVHAPAEAAAMVEHWAERAAGLGPASLCQPSPSPSWPARRPEPKRSAVLGR